MRRFVYSPDVNVYIDASDYGFIDVTDDVISGTVTRRVNAISNASVTFQNPNRKYLRKIKPMDRIVIYLTRIHQPVLVFSGYIDRSPFDQLYPGPVTITASCTLKRLMNTYWDPALPYVMQWLQQYGWLYNNLSGTMIDPGHNLYNNDFSGGLGHLLRAVMNDVGGWPIGVKGETKNTVHVMKLPQAFLTKTKKLLQHELQTIEQNQEAIDRLLNTLLTADGVSVTGATATASANSVAMADVVRDSNPLPVDVTKKNWIAAIYGERISLDPNDRSGLAIAIASAFEAKGIAGKVGVAVSLVESNLNPDDRQPDGDHAMGLFQTFPTGAGGTYHKTELTEAINNPNNPVTDYYPTSYQISDAANWFDAYQSGHPINFATATPLEIGAWAKGAQAAGDTAYASKVAAQLATAQSLIVGAPPNISTKDIKHEGQIGDVKTSNLAFFHKGGGPGQASSSELTGFTFRIKGNPYGNDSLLFRALMDKDVPSDRISIYVPGATGQGTSWAKSWGGTSHTKIVTLETSAGSDVPFSSQDTKTSAQSKGTFMYPIMAYPGFTHSVSPQGTFGNYRGSSSLGPHYHAGIDIPANEGTPLVACVTGTVLVNKDDPSGGGNYVILKQDGSNHTYTYMHLNAPSPLAVGTAVRQGQVVGHVGHTGDAGTFNHLHFEYHPNGALSDNQRYYYASAADPNPMCTAAWQSGNKTTGTAADNVDSNGANSTGVLGTTGVHINQQSMVSTAAAVNFGIELGFPAVGDTAAALMLTGSRALANDVPLFNWIDFICKASGRNFQSMPNGDFLAFYPDHFNWTGETPYFRISPIETMNLSIDIGDEELTTHVFTTGDTYYNGELNLLDRMASTVSSVESADFKTLVDVDSNFNSFDFLQRYGARPWQEDRPELKNSFMQFMYGWMTFLDKWSKQFYCEADFAFLPELFPGGIIDFPPPHNLKMYVEEVTHTFDRTSGFSTTASLTSPSYYGTGMNTAMVLADGGLKDPAGDALAARSAALNKAYQL